MTDPARTAAVDQQNAAINEVLDQQVDTIRSMLRMGYDPGDIGVQVAQTLVDVDPQRVCTTAAFALVRLAQAGARPGALADRARDAARDLIHRSDAELAALNESDAVILSADEVERITRDGGQQR